MTYFFELAEANDGATYAGIAWALASDYYTIYYVNLDTERYIKYTSEKEDQDLAMEHRGESFFKAARCTVQTRVYEEDRKFFLKSFTKENIRKALEEHGVLTAAFRLIDNGGPIYASMKITRMPGSNYIIIGIGIVDFHMKQREVHNEMQM